ncbi:laminin subunit gamma-1-like isoform X2 [Cylas formicarius]|uniref:laminin subunit gamma-1-like isoform X2 n=1 Tax=Cylas formicarius TaxID=197179 RepID=UPI0029588CD9|nr:laminin subunit gamma-1-like isoform X2 [Cylas formicarius]
MVPRRPLLYLVALVGAIRCTTWDGTAPWFSGSQCYCNGFSNRCMFDQKLYEQTGHGGHCLDCTANRDGPNCERCKPNYYMREDGLCTACNCNEVGSRNLQCNGEGKCQCKPGVVGDKCDKCALNHYDFSMQGCKSCNCLDAGSAYNQPSCDPRSGVCYCKENVEGKQCRDCKPGFFNLDTDNEFGCTPCFCYGHSSQCKSAPGYFRYHIESTFSKNSERWRAEDEYGSNIPIKYEGISQSIGVKAGGDQAIYFVAPDRFLGDQRNSYNQILDFSLRIGDSRPIPTATDILLEGAGRSITNTIFAQKNRIPTIETQNYKFRLHEHPDYGWQPRLTSRDFIALLTNLTSIKIKGTYAPRGVGFLDDVTLETASRGIAGKQALWIESCDCPSGYVGQYCESCAPGFRHSPALGGPFMNCIPCDCNGHATICDSETGKCICQHNTAGDNCELCARGYYGNALAGTTNDCLACDCPNGGACIQIEEDLVMCTECPIGYTGHKCDSCSDGYFGDPTGRFGQPKSCEPCDCNANIDLNAIGNCNTTTGDCIKCIHFTGGPKCDVCLPGYYGNALVLPKGDCKKCQCFPQGTEDREGEPICDQTTGACKCRRHVSGINCDQCLPGYYNIASGEGCHSCNCDPIGAYNQSCDLYTGQCFCRPGVTGLRCDHCEARKYGFSTDGCSDCQCDKIGSKELQCDSNGQCPCLDNVEGKKCDRCKENKYDRQRGCVDCPDCYNLVQNAARAHNTKMDKLNQILNEIEHQPTVITDEQFPDEMQKLETDVSEFNDKVKIATGDRSVFQEIVAIREREKDISRTLSELDENAFVINDKSKRAEQNLDHADELLLEVEDRLDEAQVNFESQGKKALQEAWDRSKIVGQQSEKMTQIAHEARELADHLDKKSEDIATRAKDAKNKSVEAYEKVKSANVMQQNLEMESHKMNADVLGAEIKLNKTKVWTEQVSGDARQVKDDALALLNEVNNIIVPQVDVQALRRKSKDLKDEAFRLGNKTNELFAKSEELRQSVDNKSDLSKELLQRAKEEQDEINELKNDIELSDLQAEQTITLWNGILATAESNFKLLSDSDSQTQKSKEEAEDALNTIPEIEGIILETSDNTVDAQNTLDDARGNADVALEKALQADELAKNASKNAERIKEDAEDLYRNTTFLSDEAGLMYDRVLNTEGELKNLLEKSKSNESLVNEAKEKVGRAGKDTSAASKRVTDLLGDVESILSELQNAPDISEEDINRLEEEIRLAEERLRESRLEERLESLQKEHKAQNDLIEQYKDQIVALGRDVDNIEQIANALPDGCYKRVELEP